jgi:eukaryotic-like serine/threonine-protein kinase
MTSDDWSRLEHLFEEARQQSADERAAWLLSHCPDAAMRALLSEMLATYDADPEFLEAARDVASDAAQAVTEAFVGRRVGAYRIERQIGHGGMGVVYEATRDDDEFTRRVAIKVLPPWSSPLTAERFRRERHVLATLDHPGIARLIDSGTTEDGAPYFVMEYVDGEPIDRWCRARALTTTERIALCERVCEAVAYAHQHLVVHRDLKPANLFVTADGQPKLLDFGIAALLAAEDGEAVATTRTGFTSFTPEFASPEQIRGEKVTTASDVYALGVLLYLLLTDRRPYDLKGLSPVEVMRTVCDVDPPRMSAMVEARLRPTLRGDLDTIVAMALRKVAADRYGTVAALAADLRAWREQRPVAAARSSIAYRTRRFVSRNRLAVVAATAVALAVVGGGASAVWQARRAQQRFDEVRALANTVLFEYGDAIERLPGSVPIRQRMVRDALAYLDRLAADAGDSEALQRELAAGYHKVGDVQGAPDRPSLGDYPGALASYRKALAIRQALAARGETGERATLDLASAHAAIGEASMSSGNVQGAVESLRAAAAIHQRAGLQSLDAGRARALVGRLLVRALILNGKVTDAIASGRESLATIEALTQAFPNDGELRRDLGLGNSIVGDALLSTGDYTAAEAHYRATLAAYEAVAVPTDTRSQRDVSGARERLVIAWSYLGDKARALDLERTVLKDREARFAADPGNDVMRRDLQVAYFQLAGLLNDTGQVDDAIVHQGKAAELAEQAALANPGRSEAFMDVGAAQFRYGEILDRAGRRREALTAFRRSLAAAEAVLARDPANGRMKGGAGMSWLKISDVASALGDHATALEGYERAAETFGALVAADPGDFDNQSSRAVAFERLGDYRSGLVRGAPRPDWRRAKAHYEEGLRIWTALQKNATLPPPFASKPTDIEARIRICDAALSRGR